MSITGKFVLQSNENYDKWLEAAGVPAERAAKMAQAKPEQEVTITDTTMTVKTSIPGSGTVFTNVATWGQDSPTDVAGVKYSLNVSKTSNGFKGTVNLGGNVGTVEVVVTDAGFTQVTVANGVSAKRVYKRL